MVKKRVIFGILVLVFAYFYGKSKGKIEGKIVSTTSGKVKGIISLSRDGREYYAWLGIPYAEPPVGELRFARPQPIEKWSGVKDASEYPYECPQSYRMFSKESEDCLHLNVFVPKDVPEGKLLPVLLWIHGGYFVGGSTKMYGPEYFMDLDVVVVSIQYRLGALGFLNAGVKSARGNMGLADQSLAIKWASQNVQKFSGDPKKITLFGESAGGASVHYHLLNKKNDGLISGAISQSGVALSTAWTLNEDPIGQAKSFASKVNCPTTDAQEMVECLRKVDPEKLVASQGQSLQPIRKKADMFVPTIETIIDEETFLSESPVGLVKAGKFIRVPWLTGYNENEGLLFARTFYNNETFRAFAQDNWPEFSVSFYMLTPEESKKSGAIRDFYLKKGQRADSLEVFNEITQAVTDRAFIYGFAKAVDDAAPFVDVYTYNYRKKGPSLFNLLLQLKNKYPAIVELLIGKIKTWFTTKVLGQEEEHFGVCHGDELAQEFHMPGLFSVGKGDPTYEFSKDFVKLIVDFAYDPASTKFRGVSLPKRDPKLKEPLKVIEIDDVPKVRELTGKEKSRIEFWNSFEKL